MLSIVYITCNRSNELIKSIESCEAHISIKHEYVVIDNGSIDDTKQLINQKIAEGYPIRFLGQDKNYGVSGGRNIGFKEARGDICYFIDDDATIISEGRALDDAYEFMKSNNTIMAMGTDCYDTERQMQLVSPPEIGKKINTRALIRSYVGCSHFIKKENFPYDCLYPSNLMYGSEELYAGLGIYRAGGVVMQYPELKVLHQPSAKTRENSIVRQRHGHINTYVIKQYYLPKGYSIISSIIYLFRLARFERGSLPQIRLDIQETRRRYDKQFERRMSSNQARKMIKKFGLLRII